MTWISAYSPLIIWRLLDSAVDVLIRIHHDNLLCGVNHCSTDYSTDCCVLNVAHESLLYCRRKLGCSGHLLHQHKSIPCWLKMLCRGLGWFSNRPFCSCQCVYHLTLTFIKLYALPFTVYLKITHVLKFHFHMQLGDFLISCYSEYFPRVMSAKHVSRHLKIHPIHDDRTLITITPDFDDNHKEHRYASLANLQ